MGQFKTYRRHNCDSQHRTYRTRAKCTWPRAIWITGEGPYAVLAHCHVLTVTLWATSEEAVKAKAEIDWSDCGGRCHRQHEIIELV